MSFVTATTELVAAAAQDLAGLGSSVTEAAAAVSGPTTGIAAAAEDEISVAVAAVFGDFGKQFQTLSAHAQAFHSEFVDLLTSGADAYSRSEIANAHRTLIGAPRNPGAPATAAAPMDPITRWEQFVTTTSRNAQQVFGAWDTGMTTFANGVSTGFGKLVTNPAGFLAGLQTAAQSVLLVGAPDEVAAAVTQHTLGGITQSIGSETVDVVDAHGEVYRGLIEGFLPEGPTGEVLTGVLNFAASPFSGLVMGAVGPFISPAVALLNSAGGVFTEITGGNPLGALHGLINTPVNVVDGFFNGATLNLDPLAPAVNLFFAGPGAAEQVTGLSLGFGGLFSPGQVVSGAGGPMYNGVGGSLLNSVGLHLTFDQADDFVGVLPVPALGVGPIGAAANLFSIVGQALGPGLVPPPPSPGHEH